MADIVQDLVVKASPAHVFQVMTTIGTRVGWELEPEGSSATRVRLYHTGWPEQNEHWRVSCHCWAMYLRVMRRHLEYGETVPYEQRLTV